MLYSELKEYFETAELPDQLKDDPEHRFNIPYISNCWIQQIDAYLKAGINKPECVLIKQKLQKLYNDLQDGTKWDKPKPEINELLNGK